jgi:hypothetical protein
MIENSVLLRAIDRVASVVERAFQARRTATRKGLPGGPAYALLILSFCATHIVLLQFLPARVTPVRPLAYWMVVAFAAFATVAGLITTRSSATATADKSAGTAKTMKS